MPISLMDLEVLSVNETIFAESSELRSILDCIRVLCIFASCAGYVLIECGSSRSQNAVHSVFKFTLTTAVALLTWWGFGYNLAYGRPANGIVGYGGFWIPGWKNNTSRRAIQLSSHILLQGLICTQTVFSSGCSYAERLPILGQTLHSLFMSGLVHPTVCHWIWSDDGWLLRFGAADMSGSLVVSVTSGVAGFMGTWISGPRVSRFHPRQIPLFGHNLPLTTIGFVLVAIGLNCLNCCANGQFQTDYAYISRAISVSLLSGSAAVLTFFFLSKIWELKGKMLKRRIHLSTCNALLAGMVAVSAGAGFYRYWTSLIIGSCAAVTYTIVSKALTIGKIDDPADISAVHFSGGLVGTILFAAFTPAAQDMKGLPAIILRQNRVRLFLSNLLALVCVSLWTGVCYGLLFLLLTVLKIVRFSYYDELRGVDMCKFGEPAYALRIYCASCGNQLQNRPQSEESAEIMRQSAPEAETKIITDAEGAIVPLDCFLEGSSTERYSSSEPC